MNLRDMKPIYPEEWITYVLAILFIIVLIIGVLQYV